MKSEIKTSDNSILHKEFKNLLDKDFQQRKLKTKLPQQQLRKCKKLHSCRL